MVEIRRGESGNFVRKEIRKHVIERERGEEGRISLEEGEVPFIGVNGSIFSTLTSIPSQMQLTRTNLIVKEKGSNAKRSKLKKLKTH